MEEVQLHVDLFRTMLQFLSLSMACSISFCLVPFFSRQTSLLVTAQAGLIGDCILKVTLGKNAGIAALPLSGCFVSVADCVEAPKQA